MVGAELPLPLSRLRGGGINVPLQNSSGVGVSGPRAAVAFSQRYPHNLSPSSPTVRFARKLILPPEGGVKVRRGRGGGEGLYTFQLPEIRDQVQTQVISVVPHFMRRQFLFRCIMDLWTPWRTYLQQGVATLEGLSEIMFGRVSWAERALKPG